MKILFHILLAPLSWLYGAAVDLRNKLFDWKILRSEEFDIPLISVGNITVGGTGKTPHTERLIELLDQRYKLAVLSRGYKRKTKGFVLATVATSFKRVGDEPKQIKLKYPHIPVAVCERRAEGIRRLRELHPEVNLIILDDAFQHRQIEPWLNIVLMDYNCPVYKDSLLPLGRLRDRQKQLARAQIIVATKCPTGMRPLDYRMVHKYLDLYPYQSLFFTRFVSALPVPLFPGFGQPPLPKGSPVIAMAGIANPTKFLEDLRADYRVLETLIFPDHYTFKMQDIYRLGELLENLPLETVIVVTEKDAVRLMNSKKIPDDIKRRLYYVSVQVVFLENQECDFLRQLERYITENHKYKMLHPE